VPQFNYVARNAEGKLIQGVVTCTDRAAAILQIERQRQMPIKIEVAGGMQKAEAAAGKAAAGAAQPPTQTLSLTHQFLFTEQLAHLLSAGMTLDEALGVLERRLKYPKLQGLCTSLHQSLIDGRSLSQALRDFPKIFSPLYVNMVSAGEASGALAEILKRLVKHLADVKALRDRVQEALVYPAVLVVAGIGLVVVFMTVMVPQLTGFFSQTGQALPLPTRILLAANHAIVGYWWLGVVAALAVYSLQKLYTRTTAGRRSWDYWMLRLPGYGVITRYRFYAQFARTLGTLMQNGVTLLKSLELLEDISGNEYLRSRLEEVRNDVIDGASLSPALAQRRIFPELFVDMMAVGEQTGRLADTMQMIADVYERELDKRVKITSALIPPIIMIVIAVLVGLVVFGILSAVFNLTAGLRNRVP
jgi:type II secretory pathway component PulF